jgi:bacterioferritin-associated ferredoxin
MCRNVQQAVVCMLVNQHRATLRRLHELCIRQSQCAACFKLEVYRTMRHLAREVAIHSRMMHVLVHHTPAQWHYTVALHSVLHVTA